MTAEVERRLALGLLAVAVMWRGAVLAADLPLFHDQVLYVRMAEHLAQGRWGLASLETPCLYQLPDSGGSACYPPLFPVLLAVGERLGVAAAVGGRAVSFVAGLGALVAFHRLLRSFVAAGPALVGSALFALHPLTTFVCTTAFTESLYLLLTVGAVAAVVGSGGWRGALGAGGLLGLAYLTRPEAVTLVPLVAGLALARQPDRRGLASAGWVVAGALAVAVGPLALASAAGAERSWHAEKAAFGAVIDQRLGQGSLERAYFALDDDALRFAVSEPVAAGGATGRIGADPLGFAARRAGNAFVKAGQIVPGVGGVLALGLALGAGAAAVVGGRRRELGITAAIAGFLAYALALNIVSQARLLALAVPPFAMLVAWTAHLVMDRQAQRPEGGRLGRPAWGLGAVAGVAALALCAAWSVALVQARAPEVHVAEVVGPWLRGVTHPDAVLAAHGPGTAYYAERAHRVLPAEPDPERLCRWLVASGTDCLVAPERIAEAHGLVLDRARCLQPVPGPVDAGLYAVRGRRCLAR